MYGKEKSCAKQRTTIQTIHIDTLYGVLTFDNPMYLHLHIYICNMIQNKEYQ